MDFPQCGDIIDDQWEHFEDLISATETGTTNYFAETTITRQSLAHDGTLTETVGDGASASENGSPRRRPELPDAGRYRCSCSVSCLATSTVLIRRSTRSFPRNAPSRSTSHRGRDPRVPRQPVAGTRRALDAQPSRDLAGVGERVRSPR